MALPLEHDRIPPDTKSSGSHRSHHREGAPASPGAQPCLSHASGCCCGVTLGGCSQMRRCSARLLDAPGPLPVLHPHAATGSIWSSVPPGFYLVGGHNIFPAHTEKGLMKKADAALSALSSIKKREKKTSPDGEVISKTVKTKSAMRAATSTLPSTTPCSSSPRMAPGSQHLENCLAWK